MRISLFVVARRVFVGTSLACMLFVGSVNATEEAEVGPEVDWAATFEEAMERGRTENRPVLIVFSGRAQELGVEDDY